MSAALTMVGLDQLWFSVTGGWFFLDAAIPIAVFLSMNLLITDPVTSPRTATGKVLFGALYGVGVMALYLGLRAIEVVPTDTEPGLEAAFFDKLIHVPLLNLLVIGLDRVGTRLPLERLWGARPGPPGSAPAAGLSGLPLRVLHVSIWLGVFALIRPQLVAYPGASSQFWRQACAQGSAPAACDNLLRVLAGPLAGAVHMPYRRFVLFNCLGAVLWSSTMVSLAWLGGRWIPFDRMVGGVVQFGLGALVLVVLLLAIPSMISGFEKHQLEDGAEETSP
jgi:hypothetical protein